MPIYFAPVKDQQFILHDVLKLGASDIPGYSDLDPEFTAAILDESGKLAHEIIAPLNVVGDTRLPSGKWCSSHANWL